MAAVCGAVAGCGSQPAPPAAPGAGLQEGSLPKRLTGGTPLPKDPPPAADAESSAPAEDEGPAAAVPGGLAEGMRAVGGLDGVGAAVGAASGGPILTAGTSSEAAWSTIKVPLLVTYLNWVRGQAGAGSGRDALTGAEQAQVADMITVSSNDAANALFKALAQDSGSTQGAGARIQETLAAAGDDRTRVTVAAPDGVRTFTWLGQTQWAPADSVKFLRSLVNHSLTSPADAEWILSLMQQIEGSDWGFRTALAGTATPLRYKVGVGTNTDGQTVVRQIAIIGDPGQACLADIVARGAGEAQAKDRAGSAARLVVDSLRPAPGAAIACS